MPYGSVSPAPPAGPGSATKGGRQPAAQGPLKYGGWAGEARDEREGGLDGADDLYGDAALRRKAQSAGDRRTAPCRRVTHPA